MEFVFAEKKRISNKNVTINFLILHRKIYKLTLLLSFNLDFFISNVKLKQRYVFECE